jgi:hypothetical protein
MQGLDLTISGHRAWIEYVKGQSKREPWYKEPYLLVWLVVDSPHSISGFGITLPLKEYTREELKQKVEEEGSRRFNEIITKHEKEQKQIAAEEAEKAAAQEIARKVAKNAGVELLEEDKSAPGVVIL